LNTQTNRARNEDEPGVKYNGAPNLLVQNEKNGGGGKNPKRVALEGTKKKRDFANLFILWWLALGRGRKGRLKNTKKDRLLGREKKV